MSGPGYPIFKNFPKVVILFILSSNFNFNLDVFTVAQNCADSLLSQTLLYFGSCQDF